MGVVRNPAQTYYGLNGDHGGYQYIPLSEIIDSFAATYVGEGKLCENVILNDVTFHAIRGLQELSYDTIKSTKDWEVTIPSTLVLVMPLDYVNYVKLAWSDSNGIERIIYPTSKTSNPLNVDTSHDADVNSWGGWTTDGTTTDLDFAGQEDGIVESSDTLAKYQSNSASDIGSVDADNMDDE